MSLHTQRLVLVAFLLLLTSCAEPANQRAVPVATAHPTSVPTPTATADAGSARADTGSYSTELPSK